MCKSMFFKPKKKHMYEKIKARLATRTTIWLGSGFFVVLLFILLMRK